MAVIHSPESNYAKELVKWEAQVTSAGPGLRPYLKREYPQMLYRAARLDDGAFGIAETHLVESDLEASNYFSRGFHPTPLEALDGLKAQELEIAKLAANRNFQERRMSDKARAQSPAVEAEPSHHLACV